MGLLVFNKIFYWNVFSHTLNFLSSVHCQMFCFSFCVCQYRLKMCRGLCSDGSSVSCAALYPYHRTRFFSSGSSMCHTIISRTHSLSLISLCGSFSPWGADMLWFALLSNLPGWRGNGEGEFATRWIDTFCQLPLSSIVSMCFWTLIIRYVSLMYAWSLLYVCCAMATTESSITVPRNGSSKKTYAFVVKECSVQRRHS